MTRLLIIEDNPELVANLYAFFEPLGYILDDARDGLAGLNMVQQYDYDAVLLDIMLPKLDGITLCKQIRQKFQNPVPILMLTARDLIEDRVDGLISGADDYLIKPFSLIELNARIKALVRRSQGKQVESILVWKDLKVDSITPQAWRKNQPISLTPTTHQLLMMMMRAAPNVVKKQEMEYLIWGDEPPNSGALRTHIHDLRKQVDKNFQTPLIETVYSIGWRLTS